MMTWWFWVAFLFLFIVPPLGYGWGYRGWGMPYPSYVQRRRSEAATAQSATFDHYAWGWGGDFVWMVLLAGMVWGLAHIWWH